MSHGTHDEIVAGKLLQLFAVEISEYLTIKNKWLDEHLPIEFTENELKAGMEKVNDLLDISESELMRLLSEFTELAERVSQSL